MANAITELRQRRSTLTAEANSILDLAAKSAKGEITAAQEVRLTAIKADLAADQTTYDALVDTMRTPDQVTEAVGNAVKATSAAAVEIVSLCAIAKAPVSTAHAFLKDGKSVDTVRAELAADRSGDRREDINAHRGVPNPDKASAWDKHIAKVNARVPGAKA